MYLLRARCSLDGLKTRVENIPLTTAMIRRSERGQYLLVHYTGSGHLHPDIQHFPVTNCSILVRVRMCCLHLCLLVQEQEQGTSHAEIGGQVQDMIWLGVEEERVEVGENLIRGENDW